MKRKIITALLAFSLITPVSISCSDNFAERDIVYDITSDNYFNSADDYNMALIAAYDLLHASYVNVILGEIASDNTLSGGESANDVIGWQQVDEMTHNSVNANIRDVWNWMYSGVNRAAYILEFKDKTDFEGKAQIIAEARFLHAYYNFELVKWFGGIPIKPEARFAFGDETSIPRSEPAEVYAMIEQELLLAIQDLNPKAPAVGRATKGAAQALLGKVYLYWATLNPNSPDTSKFDKAAAILDTVITDGGYSLTEGADYANMFEHSGENGIESVFEVQYGEMEGAGFECLVCSEGNVAVGFSGPRNYSGPTFSAGYSFNVPVANAEEIFEPGDLRREVTILNMEDWGDQTGATYTPGYKNTGLFNRKYIPRERNDNSPGDRNLTNPNNYRAIRYADVLLMAAEAHNRASSPNVAKAQDYVNQVRRRAFGDESHDIIATGTALTEAIWLERRRELFGEGHRFFDLVRTGKAAEAIPNFDPEKHNVFPIPNEEIQFSNGTWKQNPKYN